MTPVATHAAWTLTVAFTLSLLYEVYRATAMSGVSKHDSMAVFLKEGVPLYVVAAIVIGLLFGGLSWAPWVGLVFTLAAILVSIFYYNPRIMLERKPTTLDWFEDLAFTGLLFVAAMQLIYVLL